MTDRNSTSFRYDDKSRNSLACLLPDEIIRYKMAGYFTEEKKAISRWLEKPLGKAMKTALAFEYELTDGLLAQYPYTEEEALCKIREMIPDFTTEELLEADHNGLTEWIFIDGKKHYIHNIVRNLMRPELGFYLRGGHPDEDLKEREAILAVIADMKQNGQTTWRFQVHAEVGPAEEKAGSNKKLLAHLPIPAVLFQTDWVSIDHVSDPNAVIDSETSYWRAAALTGSDDPSTLPFQIDYSFQVTAKYVDLWSTDAAIPEKELYSAEEIDPSSELGEQLPHIRFSPYLKALAAEITRDACSDLEKARSIYNYITKNVKYSFMRDYRFMTDIADYCARNLRGDCGVQSVLFITLCRICNIPAGWQSGLYTNPYYTGAHDWTRFYIKGYGWLFADLSMGGSAFDMGDESRRQFYFGNLDPFRMCANHRFMGSYAAAKKYLPHDPCDNQLGELECDTFGYTGDALICNKKLIQAESVRPE